MGTYTFVPVVDGTFITERPLVTLQRGKVNGVGIRICDSCLNSYYYLYRKPSW